MEIHAKRTGVFRQFRVDGNPISTIVFYAAGKEVLKIPYGILESHHNNFVKTSDKVWQRISHPTNPLDIVEILEPVARAKAVNLSRWDHYYLGNKNEGYTLYLYTPDYEEMGEFVAGGVDGDEIHFVSYIWVKLPVVVEESYSAKAHIPSIILKTKQRWEKTTTGEAFDAFVEELKANGIWFEGETRELRKLWEMYNITKK